MSTPDATDALIEAATLDRAAFEAHNARCACLDSDDDDLCDECRRLLDAWIVSAVNAIAAQRAATEKITP